MNIGDWAKLNTSYGSFTFEGEYEKIAFLSGGIGITPVRSICKFATDKGLPTDIVLLYSNNREENIVFRQDLDAMQRENKNMRVVYTLDYPQRRWQGGVGLINDRMIKTEIPDFRERIFYICGPPQMVESLVDILKGELGFEEDRIKTERFTGY